MSVEVRPVNIAIAIRRKELARRLLWNQPHSEIMRDMQLTKRQFDWTIHSPEFKQELKQLEEETYGELDSRHHNELADVQKRARESSAEAMETIIKLMQSSASETLKRDCANDVLDYAGASDKRPQRQVNISANQISLIVQAAKEDADRSHNGDAER